MHLKQKICVRKIINKFKLEKKKMFILGRHLGLSILLVLISLVFEVQGFLRSEDNNFLTRGQPTEKIEVHNNNSRRSQRIKRQMRDISPMEDLRVLPTFVSHVTNETAKIGGSIVLTCHVKNLGNYKLAWVRVDTQTILTIHEHIITRNQRISLSHHDHEIWRLHMENLEEADKGWYMCQINTDPMRSQKGFLNVVVPPNIIDSRSSSEVIVREGVPVNLTCLATGSPHPMIRWRRVDEDPIRYKGGEAITVEGNNLEIPIVSRIHIGSYYCIASNGIPPTQSKTIRLRVQFTPMVWVPNQLELAPQGWNISLLCQTESYPPALHYWTFSNGTSIRPGSKYKMKEDRSDYTSNVSLHIFNVDKHDFGAYVCVAKNPLGQQDGIIKLEERHLPSTPKPKLTTAKREIEEENVLLTPTSLYGYKPYHPNDVNREDDSHEKKTKKNKETKSASGKRGTTQRKSLFSNGTRRSKMSQSLLLLVILYAVVFV